MMYCASCRLTFRFDKDSNLNIPCCPSCMTGEWLRSDDSGYNKYNVYRKDGRDCPGEKHYGCKYFVLDLTHDEIARRVLQYYVELSFGDLPADSEVYDILDSINGGSSNG